MRAALSATWIACLTAIALFMTGCDLFGSNDDDGRRVMADVVIANSGNFSAQDGSLTLYNSEDSTAALKDINVSFINSLTLRNDSLFVVDNTQPDNAGRITIFDTDQLEPIGQISNPRPPQYIAFPTENKGYITNQRLDDSFNPLPSTISVINLRSNEVSEEVDVGRSPNGIGVAHGKAFVANSADGTLSVLDTEVDTVNTTLSFTTCTRPKSVFVDDESEITVVCQGGDGQASEVLFLNPGTEEVVDRVEIGPRIRSANITQSAYYSKGAEELYTISTGTGKIFRVNTNFNVLDTTLEVPQDGELTGLTAVGYDDTTQNLYLGRLPVGDDGSASFTTAGTALVLNRQGDLVTRFETGIAPAHIVFPRDQQ